MPIWKKAPHIMDKVTKTLIQFAHNIMSTMKQIPPFILSLYSFILYPCDFILLYVCIS